MIGTELLRELIETIILTGRVRDCDPCSLLLVAAPESGKTSVVLERPCKAIEAFTDLTGRGIHMILAEKRDITHIVINDLVAVLSHKQSVNRYTISQLNALTEEGINKIATPNGLQQFEGGRRGIIASLTLEMVKDARYWWNKIGFTSRMLPFCYYYPEDLIIKIKDAIDESGGRKNGNNISDKEFRIPNSSVHVKYTPTMIKETRYISDIRTAIMREQGMRRLKQYHSLAMAHALRRTRASPVVIDDDIEFIKQIDLYTSYQEPKAL